MALRGRTPVRDFLEGFNGTYGTFQKVAQDFELRDIAKAKATTSQGFTAEDGQQLEAIANAKGPDGKPYYTVTPGENGSYNIASNFQTQDADGTMQTPAAAPIAQRGVTDFLGKRTAGTLSPEDETSARNLAMAGVYKKYGNFGEGLRLEQQAQQAQRQATADARDAQRFDWDTARVTREQTQAKIADDKQGSLLGIDRELGDWMKARLAGPVGEDGKPGPTRAQTMEDYMAGTQRRAALLTQAGHQTEAGQEVEKYRAQMHGQLMLETEQRNKALGESAAGLLTGNTQPMVDAFNKYIPDGSRVLSATVDKKTGKVTIKRETMDGHPLPDSVKSVAEIGAALEAFKNPGAVAAFAEQNFRNDLALRAESRADQMKRLAQNADTRLQTEFESNATSREAKQKEAELRLELAKLDDTTPAGKIRATEIQGKLLALSTGTRGASAGYAPADVIKARTMVSQGVYPSEGEALDAIVSKPDKLYQTYKETALKQTMDVDSAIKVAKKMMADDGWEKTAGGTWKRGTAIAPAGTASVPTQNPSAKYRR